MARARSSCSRATWQRERWNNSLSLLMFLRTFRFVCWKSMARIYCCALLTGLLVFKIDMFFDYRRGHKSIRLYKHARNVPMALSL